MQKVSGAKLLKSQEARAWTLPLTPMNLAGSATGVRAAGKRCAFALRTVVRDAIAELADGATPPADIDLRFFRLRDWVHLTTGLQQN